VTLTLQRLTEQPGTKWTVPLPNGPSGPAPQVLPRRGRIGSRMSLSAPCTTRSRIAGIERTRTLPGVMPTRAAESNRSYPGVLRTEVISIIRDRLCGLRANACGREACGTAWHPSWPRDDPAMDDGDRAVEGPPAADAACASAAASSGLHWRVDPDRRIAPLVV
jgi:hypothetical protein